MEKTLPPLERLREVLEYNPSTGMFTSKIKRGSRATPGKLAGSVKKGGRVIIQVDGIEYKAHRLAWLMHYGVPPHDEIDHVNRDQSDNRIENLRCIQHSANMLNRGTPKNNTSGALGVRWHKPTAKWKSEITIGGRILSLGYFDSKEIAVEKRKLAELMYHSPMLFAKDED